MNILIVEDDANIARHIAETIAKRGWQAEIAPTRAAGLSLVAERTFDALIVDRILPDGEGLDVLKVLREKGMLTPALALSALIDAQDRETGIELGVDDYLCKPYSERELLHRLDGLLNWSEHIGQRPGGVLRLGDVRIYLDLGSVAVRGRKLRLQTMEYEIFLVLARDAGQPVGFDRIAREGFRREFVDEGTIRVQICKLRAVLKEAGSSGRIDTVRHFGYAFVPGKAPGAH
ncbi:response regulator transcription factor [Zavarzinia aquatilis]|uniref:DNA-binding response regulator n=1 Tax=Zavarzinia aquatilis TaxID=2211142 RepID=A0A317DTA2_9PROT|nr:response regulator transcription factor [Zavarzinia aquatilis]PWR17917.1 DNA-binding response regulator [Zavarzinia aquatilis]